MDDYIGAAYRSKLNILSELIKATYNTVAFRLREKGQLKMTMV